MNPSRASLGVLLRLAHQQWTEAVQKGLAEAGFGDIRPHHANVFTFARPEGVPASELARVSGVRKQTMAQALEELERLGYVTRRPDPSDRRSRLIVLTDKGLRVQPVAMAAGERVQQAWARQAGSQVVSELGALLGDLLDAVGPGAAESTPVAD